MPEVRSPARPKGPLGVTASEGLSISRQHARALPATLRDCIGAAAQAAGRTWPPCAKSDKAAAAQRSSALRNKSK